MRLPPLSRARWGAAIAIAVAMASVSGWARDYSGDAPDNLRGPFVCEPDVIVALDCGQGERCQGPLNFRTLIEAKAKQYENVAHTNSFLLKIARPIGQTLAGDLKELTAKAHADHFKLHTEFLTDPGSRIELVGVVNRMDRQFVTDVSLTPAQRKCGEISVIYRFSYDLANGRKSRLPVTMNIVFPALPGGAEGGAVTCRNVADRWVKELERPVDRTSEQKVDDLLKPETGPLALIRGEDMLRVEINAQAYRKPAGTVHDFGSEAEYLIRVFHWEKQAKEFQPIELTNQIDRDRLLCSSLDSAGQCKKKRALRDDLVAYLQTPAAVSDIDFGTLELPAKYLAKRAVSVSPGGVHRARNQPFWKPTKEARESSKHSLEIMSDDEIRTAIARFEKTGQKLSFIKSADDFRTRLNDSTCTGCHQTRAIAGFHFPGSDRRGTPAANSVFLAGSPLFYGDQPRRKKIVASIADRPSGQLTTYELAIGYAARPLNKLAADLAGTQLLGGWGGACIMPEFLPSTQRQWTCQSEMPCKQFYTSENEKMVGTCVPKTYTEVGDPLQVGEIRSPSFETDAYRRATPKAYDDGNSRNKLIDPEALKMFALRPLAKNSYYGAHQEYYSGKDCDKVTCSKDELRDSQTGGFPAGMLRLSECRELEPDSTCGLIASTGFNDCLGRVAKSGGEFTQDICFQNFTSFAGMRACDAASPCRDDYICVSPIAKTPDEFLKYHKQRAEDLKSKSYFKKIVGTDYSADRYYGQEPPDPAWLKRDDRRGVCIPPYFVFQFRSDKHPKPND